MLWMGASGGVQWFFGHLKARFLDFVGRAGKVVFFLLFLNIFLDVMM